MAAAPRPQSGPQPSAPPAPAQSSNEPFDVFGQDMAFPGLPGAVKHQPGKAPAYESRVPDLDAGMLSSLPAAQRARLQAERDQVSQLDQQVHQVCFVHCHLLLAYAPPSTPLCAAHLLVVCMYLPCICPDTNAGMVRLSLHHLCGQMQRSESFFIKALVCGQMPESDSALMLDSSLSCSRQHTHALMMVVSLTRICPHMRFTLLYVH